MLINVLVASVVLVILDATIVGTRAIRFHGGRFVAIHERPPLYPPYRPVFAVVVYAMMLLGLNLFVVPNIHASSRWTDSVVYGGGYGLCAYGMYSLVATIVFDESTLSVALVDTLLGAFVFVVSALACSYY